jgi:hypothetical protein
MYRFEGSSVSVGASAASASLLADALVTMPALKCCNNTCLEQNAYNSSALGISWSHSPGASGEQLSFV